MSGTFLFSTDSGSSEEKSLAEWNSLLLIEFDELLWSLEDGKSWSGINLGISFGTTTGSSGTFITCFLLDFLCCFYRFLGRFWRQKSKKKQQPKTTSSDTKIRQEKVDAILDKIKASGYDSLTKAEKDYLFNASKNI